MSKKIDVPQREPVRMTKALLDGGADFRKDIIIQNYGFPIVVTIRPLTEDEIELVNSKTTKPMDAMELVRATGKTIEELRDVGADAWEELMLKAIEEGKVDVEKLKANSSRYLEIVKMGVVDEVVRANPEKLMFGALTRIGNEIERISTIGPKELEIFLRPAPESEPQ